MVCLRNERAALFYAYFLAASPQSCGNCQTSAIDAKLLARRSDLDSECDSTSGGQLQANR